MTAIQLLPVSVGNQTYLAWSGEQLFAISFMPYEDHRHAAAQDGIDGSLSFKDACKDAGVAAGMLGSLDSESMSHQHGSERVMQASTRQDCFTLCFAALV